MRPISFRSIPLFRSAFQKARTTTSRQHLRNFLNAERLERRDVFAVSLDLVENDVPLGGINDSQTGSDPAYIQSFGDSAFYVANQFLWKVEATGTAQQIFVTDSDGRSKPFVAAGNTPSNSFGSSAIIGDYFYFAGGLSEAVSNDVLWRTDTNGTFEPVPLSVPLSEGSLDRPLLLKNIGGTLYYTTAESTNGQTSLWRVNSSGAQEKVPTPDGFTGFQFYTELVDVDGIPYFAARESVNGVELWRVSSTTGALELVETSPGHGGIRSGDQDSNPSALTNINGVLYFQATDDLNGSEAWRIDASGQPELLSGGINAGTANAVPREFVGYNDAVYFSATDDGSSRSIWKFDPVNNALQEVLTETGTSLAGGLDPLARPTVHNGDLYVSANELWRINSDIAHPLLANSFPIQFFETNVPESPPILEVGDVLYVSSGGGLVRIVDGDTVEPVQFEDDNGPIENGVVHDFQYLTNVGGTLFFRASDFLQGTGTGQGSELWRVDADGKGRHVPGTLGGGQVSGGEHGSKPQNLRSAQGMLFFTAFDRENGRELWRVGSDGAAEMVNDETADPGLNDASLGSNPAAFTPHGFVIKDGSLYFPATDGLTGVELRRMGPDGIVEIVDDAQPGIGAFESDNGSFAGSVVNFKDSIYFEIDQKLSRVNSSGLVETVLDTSGNTLTRFFGADRRDIAEVSGTLYFFAQNSSGQGLWKLNEAGLAEFVSNTGIINHFLNANGTLYYTNASLSLYRYGSTGSQLISTGTTIGGEDFQTTLTHPKNLVNIGDTVFFTASTAATGEEVWRVGTTGIPELVTAGSAGGINPGAAGSSPNHLTSVNGTLFWSATNSVNGGQLWKVSSTGLAQMVTAVGGGLPGDSNTRPFTNVNGTLYFGTGTGLWRVNETGSAQRLLNDAGQAIFVRNATEHNQGFVFTYSLDFQTYQLAQFKPDGTFTSIVNTDTSTNVLTAANILAVSSFVNVNGVLYLTANAAKEGLELWRLNITDPLPPVDIELSNNRVAENSPVGTVVGLLSASDPNFGDTIAFTSLEGPEFPLSIVGREVQVSGPLDFEVSSSLLMMVRATDSFGNIFPKQLTVHLLDRNDSPTNIELSSSSVVENAPVGTSVGTLTSFDSDASETFTYSLVSGQGASDNFDFRITGDRLETAVALNFEAKSTRSIRVRSTDHDGQFFDKTFTINVTNINEAPINISLSPSSVAENVAIGTPVGLLSSTDEDAGDSASYSLVPIAGNNSLSFFTLVGNQIRVAAPLDFEQASSYQVRVRATDSGILSFDKTLTIQVSNVNEAPTGLVISTNVIAEELPVGSPVGILSAIDPDFGDTASFTIVPVPGNTDSAAFTIQGNELRTAVVLDYEVKNSYSLKIQATDGGGNTFQGTLNIQVSNATESVNGINWLDSDGDGARDPGEPGLSGWIVYADLNKNGLLDNAEPQTTTLADAPGTPTDENGSYTLPLAPGNYTIARVPATLYLPTYPTLFPGTLPQSFAQSVHQVTLGGQSIRQRDFGNTVPRTVNFDSSTATFSEGSRIVTLTGNLDSALGTELIVPITISADTALTTDYRVISSSMIFAAGSTHGSFNIELIDDNRFESTESFTVSLASSSTILLGSVSQVQVSINDNDTPPTLRFASSAQATSEGATAIVEVSLVGESDQAVVVPIQVLASSTATADSDFHFVSANTITIPAGSRSGSLSIAIDDDTLGEGAEQIRLGFGAVTDALLSTSASDLLHVITISQNDTPTVSFAQGGTTRSESAGDISAVLTLTNPSNTAITVPFTVGGSASSADRKVFVDGIEVDSTQGTVTFAANESLKTITLRIINDTDSPAKESTESTTLTIDSLPSNVVVGSTRTFTLNIEDDDTPSIQFSATNLASIFEDQGTHRVTVTSSLPSDIPIVVPISLLSLNRTSTTGYALADEDFAMTFSSLTIQPGDTSAFADLVLTDDNDHESSEAIVLSLGTPTSGVLGLRQEQTITLLDDDANVNIARSQSSLTESTQLVTFTVSLDAVTNQDVLVQLYPSGTATLDSDYTLLSGVTEIDDGYYVEIMAGSTTSEVTVQVLTDTREEGSETITFSLAAFSGGVIVPSGTAATITIVDEASVSFATADFSIYESSSQPKPITVQLTSAKDVDVYVKPSFSPEDVGAIRNQDYSISGLDDSGRIMIPANSTSATFFLHVQDDARENDRSFRVGIESVTNANAMNSTVFVAIIDNDPPAPPQPAPRVSATGTDTGVFDADGQLGPISSGPRSDNPPSSTEGTSSLGTNAVVSGGFLTGTTVFFDSNFNGKPDFLDISKDGVQQPNEPSERTITTRNDGSFTAFIDPGFDRNGNGKPDANEGRWVTTGGKDTSTNLDFEGRFYAPAGLYVFSPLSSIVSELVRQGLSLDDALPRMMSGLGLPQIANFGAFNTLASLQNGDAIGGVYWTKNIQVYNTVIDIAKLFAGSPDGLSVDYYADLVFADLAARISTANSVFEVNDQASIANVIGSVALNTGIALAPAIRDGAAVIISTLNSRLSSIDPTTFPSPKEYAEALVKIKIVAQQQAANSLRDVSAGSNDISTAVNEFTGTNLQSLIDAAVPGQVFPVKVGVANAQVVEGNSGKKILEFSVQVIGENLNGFSVSYATESESAGADDFASKTGILNWDAGDISSKSILITVNGDDLLEPDELLKVVLSSSDHVVLLKSVGYGFIINDDGLDFTSSTTPPSGGNRLTLDLSEESARLVENGSTVSSGKYFAPLQIQLHGQPEASDSLELNFEANSYRGDSITFTGGIGSGTDTLKFVSGTFEQVTHHLGQSETVLDPIGAVSSFTIHWSELESTELTSTINDLLLRIPMGSQGILEDADPTQPGLMRLRPQHAGDFAPTLFRNPLQSLTVAGGIILVSSLDAGFTGDLLLPDNPPLTATVQGPSDGFGGVVGQSRPFTFTTSAGSAKLFTYTIDWKDGSPVETITSTQAAISEVRTISHQFLTVGTFTPTVEIAIAVDQKINLTLPQQTIASVQLQGNILAIGVSNSTSADDLVVVEPTSVTGVIRVTNRGIPVAGSTQGEFNLTSLEATGIQVFTGAGIDSLTLRGGSNNDLFNISGTQASVASITLFYDSSIEQRRFEGLAGSDQFLLQDSTAITIDGGTGLDTFASSASQPATWTIAGTNQGTLSFGSSSTAFSAIENLRGSDTAADSFVFAASGLLTGSIIAGLTSNDMLDLRALTSSVSVDLKLGSATNVQGGWVGIEEFRATNGALLGADANSVWTLSGVNAGSVTSALGNTTFSGFRSLSGGSGNDTFVLGPGAQITGALNGGGGIDALDLSSMASVSVSLVTNVATNVGQYSSIESFIGSGANSTLSAANLNNLWTITGPDTGVINGTNFSGFGRLVGGLLADQFSFANNGSLSGSISASSGVNSLSLASRTVPVRLNVAGLAPAIVDAGSSAVVLPAFTQITSFTGTNSGPDVLMGPAASTKYLVTGLNSGTYGTGSFSGFEQLLGGDAADTFTINAGGSLESIGGGGGIDALVAAAGNNNWIVSGIGAGQLNSIVYAAMENLTGSSGDDLFELLPAGQVTGALNGGAGFNTLSYRQRTSPVAVNLAAGVRTATNVASILDSFSVIVGGSANDSLIGSRTRDMVLIGGSGDDSLTGGLGRDILIGGLGSDTLRGGAGRDILIGGLLSFESNSEGLKSILLEWENTTSFDQIRSNLQGVTNTGLNGSYFLRNNTEDTLLDDSAVDSLFGGDDIDWYIASLSDVLEALKPGEQRDAP